MDVLEARIRKLEGPIPETKEHQRVLDAIGKLDLASKIVRVPKDYYGRSLDERAKLLRAYSIKQLCKSVLVKNTAWVPSSDGRNEIWNSEYYLVIVQYVEQINSEKLRTSVRLLLPEELRNSKASYQFRMATTEEADVICGFEHNAIPPVGLLIDTPMIVAKSVLNLGSIWLGGGEIDLKMKVNVEQFIKNTNAIVADISDPRDPSDLDNVTLAAEVSTTPEKSANKEILALFSQLELRVGKIIAACNHADSDKLMVETIDLGEEQPRQILSGIAKYYQSSELVNKNVVVLCNLKAAKLGGMLSAGMVMCGVSHDGATLRVVEAPAECAPGAKIHATGQNPSDDYASPAQMKKKKIFESVVTSLAVDEQMRPCVDGVHWQTDCGALCYLEDGLTLPAQVR